tara:strand:+ start:2881 stop:3321 length:441 start_codon:yes stop_codon:yes gene_type:complete
MSLLSKELDTLKNMSSLQVIFIVLIVIYILSGVNIPYNSTQYFNKPFVYASLIIAVFVFYLYTNKIITLVFLIGVLVFMNRSYKIDLNINKPSQQNKNKVFNNLNSHLRQKTLEEEIVQSIKKLDNIPNTSNYHPVLCDAHNAEKI